MKKVFLLLTMLLFAFAGTMRADELTVNDGTDGSSYVPVYGLWADAYLRCQYVIPADDLGDMEGGQISGMTFYLKTSAPAAWTGTFQVYMTEVNDATISAFIDPSTATTVFTGNLDATGTTMTVTFATDYSYGGGNLLVGFDQIEKGNYKSATFYGVTATGASGSNYNSASVNNVSFTQRNFLPKTTFEYTPGAAPECAKPKNLAVNYEGGLTAEISWTGEADAYNIQVNDLLIEGVTENPYTLEDLEMATVYNVAVQADCGSATSDWTNAVSFTTDLCYEEDMCEITFVLHDSYGDGWNGNYIAVVDVETEEEVGSVTIVSGSELTTTMAVCDGREVAFVYVVPGQYTYPNETSYEVYDRNNIEIFHGSGKMTEPVYYTVDCSEMVPEIEVLPEPLYLGYRPMGAWMEPFVAQLNCVGLPSTVTVMISDNEYFGLDVEVPFTMEYGEMKDFNITTGDIDSENDVDIEGNLLLLYSEAREYTVVPMTATAYIPEEGDVWEVAQEVEELPFSGTPGNIYHNYNIPGSTLEHVDAVYKVTLENSALLNVNIGDAENPAVALYAEDFNGEPGPKVNNTYKPGGAPTGEWYQYGEDEFATSIGAGGSFFWAVMFPAGSYEGDQVITAATYEVENYPFEGAVYVCNGGDTAPGDIVGEMPVSVDGDENGWAEFTFPAPVAIDPAENLWIVFRQMSGSNYPAGACVDAGDPNARWASINGTTWGDLANFGVPGYSWMIKAFVGTGFRGEVTKIGTLPQIPAAGTLAVNPVKPETATRVNYNTEIEDMYIPAGTYYVVVASTGNIEEVNISTNPVPAPGQADVNNPEDGESNVPTSFTAQWELGEYTDEIQIILDTQYPPQAVLVDWTNVFGNSYNITGLEPNQSYFMQVNARNASGTTYGEIVAFTTVISPVEGFEAVSEELYPGDDAVFVWDANRTFLGYNLYLVDGEEYVKMNEDLITETTYAVEGLTYNMEGYDFVLTAVYGAGESLPTEPVTVKMTGYATVSGTVYDTDETVVVPFADVEFRGTDEHGEAQVITLTTDEDGFYSGEVLAGAFEPYSVKDGYAVVGYGAILDLEYEGVYENINIITHEYYYPLGRIKATEVAEDVLVEWSWELPRAFVDFETGDFSQYEFNNSGSYPWTITTDNVYAGVYSIMSSNGGVSNSESVISAQYTYEEDGGISFAALCMGEGTSTIWDKCMFAIDGTVQFTYGANQSGWHMYEYEVAAGTHTFTWTYSKDSSVNPTGDCMVVDNILMYEGENEERNTRSLQGFNLYRRNNISDDEPVLIATPADDVFEYTDAAWAELPYGEYQWGIQATYDGYAVPQNRDAFAYTFDNGLDGWTNIDADGDGHVWFNSAESQTYSCYSYESLGHSGCFMVSQSYTDCTYDAYNADNYLVSPQKYPIDANSSITFWQDYGSDSYPDFFEVMVSTAANPGANDFTSVWAIASKGHGDGVKVRHNNNRYENWTEYNVSLAAYAGQEVWIAFHHEDYDNYELWLDDVTITAGGSNPPTPPTPPTPQPGDGLSEIIWSNVIDKDMVSDVTFNVALNNGQSPEGIEVGLIGEGGEESFVMDETGTKTLQLRKGAYILGIEAEGYNIVGDLLDINDDVEEFSYVLIETIASIDTVMVSATGWVHWDGATPGPGPLPPTPPVGENATIILSAGDVWGDGSGYQMLLDDTHSLYGTTIPTTGALSTACSGNEGIYAQFSHKIPENADGNCTTSNIVINNSIAITIPAGTYDWCITNPTPGDRIWIAGGNGNVGGRYDDYVFEAGATYEFTPSRYGNNDGVDVTITGAAKMSQPKMNFDMTDCKVATAIVGNRAPMSYKVMLDNEYVGETVYPFMQLPVEGIEPGSTHEVMVAPLYATGMGEWTRGEWTYNPCNNYTGAIDYSATVDENNVTIEWTLPGEPGPGPTPPTPPTGDATIILTAGDVWGDGSGYQMLLDDTHSLYGSTIPTSGALSSACSGNDAIYAQFSHKIPTNADGNCTTSNIVINNSVTITVPAGTYDWCITNPTPGDRIWIAASNGNVGGRYDDYVFEAGNTYEFTVSLFGSNDGVNVTITGGSKLNQPKMNFDVTNCKVGERSISSVLGTTAYANVIYSMNWSEGYGSFDIDNPSTFSVLSSANADRGGEYYDGYFYGYSSTNVFYKINYETGAVVEQHSVSTIMTEMAYNYADNTMYGVYQGVLYTIDLTTGAATQVASMGSSVMAFGIDLQGNAYGMVYTSGTAYLNSIDLTTGALTEIGSTGVGINYVQCGGFDHNTETFYWFQIVSASSCALYSVNLETAAVTMLLNTPGEVVGFFVPYEAVPQPTGNIMGVMVWRDGELLTTSPVNNINAYVDEDVEPGVHEYAIRVVYDDWTMSCEQTMEVEITPAVCEPVTNLAGTQETHPTYGQCIYVTWEGDAVSYNVYEGTELLGSTTQHAVIIYDIPTGDYTIGVEAVYADCVAEIQYTTVHFVDAVEEVEVVNAIYPNPTSGDLHVNATAMTHVSVYNAMGQMVYDQEVSGDEMVIDMSQYESGVYMVKVTTETGSSVKRINVVK